MSSLSASPQHRRGAQSSLRPRPTHTLHPKPNAWLKKLNSWLKKPKSWPEARLRISWNSAPHLFLGLNSKRSPHLRSAGEAPC